MLDQYVFNDKEVQSHFDQKLWVCVSKVFDVKTIVQKIIECAIERRPESNEIDLLQRQLRAEIDGKRYLLVLDYVWNEDFERWSSLKKLLVGGKWGSKVLVTTRSKKVAEIIDKDSLFLLGGLSESNS
ncbi:disease resistance protein RGA2-like [Corylus avellana]|uniref:disease resistance protein RGA2-like n=1 Tax=Corylus avellana TaxID=13451 RepID=UPI00286BF90E|nr:disease resistance protein RGA2-like [Corylus avellana]